MLQEAANSNQPQTIKEPPRIWINNIPYSLETLSDFLREAEKMRKTYPGALVSILTVRNGFAPENFGKNFPQEHAWFNSIGAQTLALMLAPVFYKLKTHSLGNHGNMPAQREDVVDAIECDLKSHREILRLILEGVF